jgi:hypothetical protein
MRLILLLVLSEVFFAPGKQTDDNNVFSGKEGTIHFISQAPLEAIEAKSAHLAGAINAQTREVYFAVRLVTFNGFNSALQQEHFNENYMESDLFPMATFKGKLLDEVDFGKSGINEVRVKGNLTIHGVTQEKIVSGKIILKGNTMQVEAGFPVALADYNISIPKIVEMKIAKEVKVNLKIELTRNNS